MENVLLVLQRDILRLFRAPAALLVVIFLIVLPSLYTWINVIGFWNPYDETSHLPVCVVNEDAGAESELTGSLDLGAQIVAELQSNNQLGWEFTNRQTAMEKVESGQAYAAFIIPENFSYCITTLLTGNIEHPQLEYYVNEKLGAVGPKITDVGATTLDQQINSTFVSTASSTIAKVLNNKTEQAQTDVSEARLNTLAELDKAATTLAALQNTTSNIIFANEKALSKISTIQKQVDTLSTELPQEIASTSTFATLVSYLQTTLAQLTSTLKSTLTALSQTCDLLANMQTDVEHTRSTIESFSSPRTLAHILGTDGAIDPEKIASFMLSPTQLKTTTLYPLNSYGAAMSPLFMNLTLWIGVFMLMVVLRQKVDAEHIKNLTLRQSYLARWLFLAPIVGLQALVCCLGTLVIGVQVTSIPLFCLTAVMASLTYLSIQFALSISFQHIGKGLCIMLVFAQIPSASGLYPIEVTPAFFQALYPLLPFTYGINALRETIAGFYGYHWISDVGVLCGFALAAFLLGLYTRNKYASENKLFSEQIKEAGILNIEETTEPESIQS